MLFVFFVGFFWCLFWEGGGSATPVFHGRCCCRLDSICSKHFGGLKQRYILFQSISMAINRPVPTPPPGKAGVHYISFRFILYIYHNITILIHCQVQDKKGTKFCVKKKKKKTFQPLYCCTIGLS